MTPAMRTLEAALNAKRKEMYGDRWEELDWWGLPIKKPEPRPKESVFIRNMAEKIAEGMT